MRIIAGKNKGKKLKSFTGNEVRPTSDRARESLFNILASSVVGCEFLDLCCGTGAMGIEAYSRGASTVTFVDNSRDSIKLCKENANSVGILEEFIIKDALSFVKSCNKKYGVIFFDPPYAFCGASEVLTMVKQNGLLKEGGVFIYEHDKNAQAPLVEGLKIVDTRKYGIAVFDFYEEIV